MPLPLILTSLSRSSGISLSSAGFVKTNDVGGSTSRRDRMMFRTSSISLRGQTQVPRLKHIQLSVSRTRSTKDLRVVLPRLADTLMLGLGPDNFVKLRATCRLS